MKCLTNYRIVCLTVARTHCTLADNFSFAPTAGMMWYLLDLCEKIPSLQEGQGSLVSQKQQLSWCWQNSLCRSVTQGHSASTEL